MAEAIVTPEVPLLSTSTKFKAMPLGADQKLATSLAIGESVQRCLTGDLTLTYRQKQCRST